MDLFILNAKILQPKVLQMDQLPEFLATTLVGWGFTYGNLHIWKNIAKIIYLQSLAWFFTLPIYATEAGSQFDLSM